MQFTSNDSNYVKLLEREAEVLQQFGMTLGISDYVEYPACTLAQMSEHPLFQAHIGSMNVRLKEISKTHVIAVVEPYWNQHLRYYRINFQKEMNITDSCSRVSLAGSEDITAKPIIFVMKSGLLV
jgi:hypothetical protein